MAEHWTDADSIAQCGKGFSSLSQCQLYLQTLLQCLHSPRVQSQLCQCLRAH